MSVKKTIHQWIDSIPDDSPGLRELYEEARLSLAISAAEISVGGKMGEAAFGVDFAADAWADLACTEFSNPIRARLGRSLRDRGFPHAREILAFGVYRIIYGIDDETQRVKVLRFWPAHRRDPSRDD